MSTQSITSFTLAGHISNRQSLISKLSLAADVSSQALVEAAFAQWALNFNQHVAGDYAIILPLPQPADAPAQPLFCCLSAFSSYTLFTRIKQQQLQLSTQLNSFNHQAVIDPVAMAQILDNGLIVAPQTLFKGVTQLNNGQSQLWSLTATTAELSASSQLTLQQKINIAASDNNAVGDISVIEAVVQPASGVSFNQLPGLSYLLNQPINASWQIQFDQQMADAEIGHIVSDDGIEDWIELFEPTKPMGSIKQVDVAKKLTQPLLNKARKDNRQILLLLESIYHHEMGDWQTKVRPNFVQWFNLTYRLPTRWAQRRLISEHHGKTIEFACIDSHFIQQLLERQPIITSKTSLHDTVTPGTDLFSFEDASISNIYDAMQRLMTNSFKPVTKRLYNIVTPYSANIFKLHDQHPELVQRFCYQTLTLDYLSRHLGWSVDE